MVWREKAGTEAEDHNMWTNSAFKVAMEKIESVLIRFTLLGGCDNLIVV